MTDSYLSAKTVSFINYFFDFIARYDKDIKTRLVIDNTYSDAYLTFFGKDVEITIKKGNRFASCCYNICELPTYLEETDVIEKLAMDLINKLKTNF